MLNIGYFKVSLVIDVLFDVPCRLLHVRSGLDLASDPFSRLEEHFSKYGSPVMMGGDADASSKGVFGTRRTDEGDKYLLIVDPHFWRGKGKTAESLQPVIDQGYIAWKRVPQDFCESSFYNLCMPLMSAK